MPKIYAPDPKWVDEARLDDRVYLSAITAGIYVMISEGDPGLCRSGVIGVKGMTNDAWRRLQQLKRGSIKHECPWRFLFLAPLPKDLGPDLRQAEIHLQNALAAEFDVGRKDQFRTTDFERVRQVAGQATCAFLASMERAGTAELEAALADYVDATAKGAPRHADERHDVLNALRMCIDGPLAEQLLAAVR